MAEQPMRTWHDLVRVLDPNATDEMCEFLLWERTAFPFVSPRHVYHQLRQEVRCPPERRVPDPYDGGTCAPRGRRLR